MKEAGVPFEEKGWRFIPLALVMNDWFITHYDHPLGLDQNTFVNALRSVEVTLPDCSTSIAALYLRTSMSSGIMSISASFGIGDLIQIFATIYIAVDVHVSPVNRR